MSADIFDNLIRNFNRIMDDEEMNKEQTTVGCDLQGLERFAEPICSDPTRLKSEEAINRVMEVGFNLLRAGQAAAIAYESRQ